MAASGNRRFLYQPQNPLLPACSGVSSATGNPGELLGSLKEEFPQLQPCPLEHPSGPFRGTGCLAGGRSMLKTPGVPSPFSLA